MIQVLSILTTIVDLLGLAASLHLGLYIVTRSPRRRLSWLAALTLWSLTSFFLHNALAINVPQSSVLPWLRPLVVLMLPLWFHLTLLLLSERARRRLWFYLLLMRLSVSPRRLRSLSPTIRRLGLLLVYGLALMLMAGGGFPPGPPSQAGAGAYLYLSGRTTGPLYLFSIAFLIVLAPLAFLNLWQGRTHTRSRLHRRQFTCLLIATALAGLGALYISFGVWQCLDLPLLPGDTMMGTAVILLGYAVAKHNALVEGRMVERDLSYISLAIGSLTVFYVIVAGVLYLGGHVFSVLTLIMIILVSVSSLTLYDSLRTTLDRLFYRQQFHQLRANLRILAREAGTGQTLPEQLQTLLSALCHTFRIEKGFIALRKDDVFVCGATEKAGPVGGSFSLSTLATTEIVTLPQPGTQGPQGMALMVPLHAGSAQIGALVLGSKETDQPYSEEDLMLLDDLVDQLVIVIQASRLQEESARAINQMVAGFWERGRALQRQVQQMLAEREEEDEPILEGIAERDFVSLVEDALRRLYDFPYLGEHALAQLQIVNWHLAGRKEAFVTHIDRGKALDEVLLRALHKLRPGGAEPKPDRVPPREWHQFIILYDSYVLGKLTRDIMSRLYISEGTFHRTRRRAVRGVAKALQEMERQARQKETF